VIIAICSRSRHDCSSAEKTFAALECTGRRETAHGMNCTGSHGRSHKEPRLAGSARAVLAIR